MAVDFPSASACIELDVDCDDPDPNVYTRIKFRLTGLSLFVVEPPDIRISLSYGETFDASGYETSDKMLPNRESSPKHAPAGSSFSTSPIRPWNCFTHLPPLPASPDSS